MEERLCPPANSPLRSELFWINSFVRPGPYAANGKDVLELVNLVVTALVAKLLQGGR